MWYLCELARWLREHKAQPLPADRAAAAPARRGRLARDAGGRPSEKKDRASSPAAPPASARRRARELAKRGWQRRDHVREEQGAGRPRRRRHATALRSRATWRRTPIAARSAKAVLDKWGRIDALVNSAGTTKFVAHGDLEGLSAEDFLSASSASTSIGPFQMIRACAAALKEAHGCDGQRLVGGRAARHRLVGRLCRIEGRARHHDPLARARARAGSARERRRAGVRAARRGRSRTHGADGAAELERRYRRASRRSRPRPRPQDVAEAIVWLIEGARQRHRPDRSTSTAACTSPRLVDKAIHHVLTTSSSAPARRAACSPTGSTEDPAKQRPSARGRAARHQPLDPRPLGYGKLFARTDINWAYESEPEPALNGRRVFTPRGKVLGGSSSINGLVYIRGQPRGLRRLGDPGLELRRAAAVLQEVREPEPRRERMARRRRAARVSDLPTPRALRCVHRFGGGARHPAQRRFQRRAAGRHRLLPGDDLQGPALQHRDRLPAPGREAAEPARSK